MSNESLIDAAQEMLELLEEDLRRNDAECDCKPRSGCWRARCKEVIAKTKNAQRCVADSGGNTTADTTSVSPAAMYGCTKMTMGDVYLPDWDGVTMFLNTRFEKAVRNGNPVILMIQELISGAEFNRRSREGFPPHSYTVPVPRLDEFEPKSNGTLPVADLC